MKKNNPGTANRYKEFSLEQLLSVCEHGDSTERALALKIISNEQLVDILNNGSESEQAFAMELLLEKNNNLIGHVMHKYYHTYCVEHQDDMWQEGRLAIFSHAKDFDPSRGTFSTFITPYIKDAIKMYICEIHGISPHYAVQVKKLNAAINDLAAAGVDNLDFGQLAEIMGVGPDAVARIYSMSQHLNMASIEGDGKSNTLASPMSESPYAQVAEAEKNSAIHRAVDKLPKGERAVINATFFGDSDRERSLSDVAKELGMSTSEVRRLKNLALRRMAEFREMYDYDFTPERRQLDDYAQTLTATFILPEDVVRANVDIAITLD